MIDHLTDDVLVRRADGELGDGETERVGRHLAGCARCRGTLAELEALSRQFSRAVALVDPPASRLTGGTAPSTARAPSRRPGLAPFWRAAAVIALLAGLALAIPPVRAWMAERLGLTTERVGEAPGDEVATPAAPAGGALRIAFLHEGHRFVVRVSVAQAAGRLTLTAVAGDSVVAEVGGAGGDPAELLVLPDGLGIRNHPSSRADYEVVVPLRMSEVEVRIGDRVAWSGSPRLLRGSPALVPLAAGGSP